MLREAIRGHQQAKHLMRGAIRGHQQAEHRVECEQLRELHHITAVNVQLSSTPAVHSLRELHRGRSGWRRRRHRRVQRLPRADSMTHVHQQRDTV